MPSDVVIKELETAGFVLDRLIDEWNGRLYCLVFKKPAGDPSVLIDVAITSCVAGTESLTPSATRDLAIDHELADMETTHLKVLYSQRTHMPSLQAHRTYDHASNRQCSQSHCPQRQRADRDRADGCSPQ